MISGEIVEDRYIVLGAGGHAKIVLDILKKQGKFIYGLTDASIPKGETCMGYPVIGDDTELPFLLKKGICNAVMGIGHVGYPKVRNSVYKKTLEIGFSFPNLIHPTAVIADTVEMGEGSLFAAQCVVNADAKIGTLCIVNTLAVIEHEVNIGDGVHIAPHATVLGQASVGQNSFIGAGSIVLQGVHVGKNCIIGAGSVVLHDIEDNCIMVGNPARLLRRRK